MYKRQVLSGGGIPRPVARIILGAGIAAAPPEHGPFSLFLLNVAAGLINGFRIEQGQLVVALQAVGSVVVYGVQRHSFGKIGFNYAHTLFDHSPHQAAVPGHHLRIGEIKGGKPCVAGGGGVEGGYLSLVIHHQVAVGPGVFIPLGACLLYTSYWDLKLYWNRGSVQVDGSLFRMIKGI